MMQSIASELRQNTSQLRDAIENDSLELAIKFADERLVLLDKLSSFARQSDENGRLARTLAVELAGSENEIISSLETRKSEVGELLMKLGIGSKATNAYNDCREK